MKWVKEERGARDEVIVDEGRKKKSRRERYFGSVRLNLA